MTNEHAPWDQRTGTVKKHYRRTSILTSGFIPAILKEDLHFNDRKDASQLSDSGQIPVKSKPKPRKITLHPLDLVEDVKDDDKGNEEELNKDAVCLEEECELVTIKGSKTGKFYVIEEVNNRIILESNKTIINPYDISNIALRRQIHRDTAIEIFMNDGRSYFINLFNTYDLGVIKRIRRCWPVLKTKVQFLPSYLYHLQICSENSMQMLFPNADLSEALQSINLSIKSPVLYRTDSIQLLFEASIDKTNYTRPDSRIVDDARLLNK